MYANATKLLTKINKYNFCVYVQFALSRSIDVFWDEYATLGAHPR